MLVHESSINESIINYIKYSADGNLIFVCWRNMMITVHRSDNAVPIGSYEEGHDGSVVSCDVTIDSSKLFSAGRASKGILWDAETGKILNSVNEISFLQSSNFSADGNLIMYSIVKKMKAKSAFNMIRDIRSMEPVACISTPSAIYTHAHWVSSDRIISASNIGNVELHDFKNAIGKTFENIEASHLRSEKMHTDDIRHLGSNLARNIFVTTSIDKTCKIFDPETLEPFFTVNFEDQANSASIHPNNKYLIVTGGQPPVDVTQTSHDRGNFYTKFYYIPTGKLYAQCKSHFGTPYACQFSPRGDSFSSGGIDGFLKVHALDSVFTSYERGLVQALSVHA